MRAVVFSRRVDYVDGAGRKFDLVGEFIDSEMATFPKSKYDDMMDCLSRVYDQDLNLVFPAVEVSMVDVRGGTWWKILEAGGGLLMLSKDEAVKIAGAPKRKRVFGLGLANNMQTRARR